VPSSNGSLIVAIKQLNTDFRQPPHYCFTVFKSVTVIKVEFFRKTTVIHLTRLWAERRGFDSRQRIFLFATASRRALVPTHPSLQWVPGALFPGIKRSGCEGGHSSPFSAEVKYACNYISIFHTSS